MSEKGLSIHRTGEKNRRRIPTEDGGRRRVRDNIVPFDIDDMDGEDLSASHDGGISEEDRVVPIFQEKVKKSDEELVDNFLLSIFGKEALERDDFLHSELVEPIARTIVILAEQKAKENQDLNSELLALAQKAETELKSLDEAEDFSKQKLFYFLEQYKKSLAELVGENTKLESINNMSKNETTPPAVEQASVAEATETRAENPAEVAAETTEQINQQADAAINVAPAAAPEINQLATEAKTKISLVYDPETDRFFDPISGTELKPEKEEVLKNVRLDADSNYDMVNEDFAMPNLDKKNIKIKENSKEENITPNLESERQKEVQIFRGLIKILEAAYGAPGVDGWSQKKSALQEAARILANEKYAILADEITKDDLKKNKAIEEAILEAEAKIRNLESGDNIEKVNVENVVHIEPVAEKAPIDIDKLVKESAAAVEADPNIQEARRRLDGNGFETKTAESDPELGQKRSGFWEAVRKRGNIWSGGRHLGIFKQKKETLDNFEEIKKAYDESLAQERDSSMQEFVASLDSSLNPEQRNAKITQKYIELMKEEENQIDSIATNTEARTMVKFKSWWKKTAIKRGILGAGLWAAGAFTGGAGFLAAKAGLKGIGSYMLAESFLDTRTAILGQKGLIDNELRNIGFKRGEAAHIDQQDKKEYLKRLLSDEFSLEQIEQEHARLRILSLDKSSKMTEAGRFGAEQILMVEAVQEAYYRRKAQQFVEKTQTESQDSAKATMLSAFLSQEQSATETATSEQDKSRSKAIKRHLVAGALGLTVGLLRPGPDTPEPEDAPEIVAPVEEVPIVDDVISDKGDTVWGMVKERLAHEVPDWDKLNEAEQTRYIDYFENKVVADPSRFGIIDVDHLQEGTTIHWGDLFADNNLSAGMDWVKELTPEQMQAITENNDILQEAAKNGVEITSKNVNEVIAGIRANGLEQYLAEHGHATAQAVVENAQEVAGAHAETAANIVEHAQDTEVVTETSDVANDVETLEDMGGSDKIYNFVHDQGPYDSNLLKMAQRMGELSSQHGDVVDEVVNKVFDSSAEIQQQFLQDFNPTDFTEGNNKAEIFLKMIQESGKKLSDIDSMDKLKGLIGSFDSLSHNPELPVGKAFEPRLIFGKDGSEAYVFIKSAGKKVLGLFGERQYIIDGLTGSTRTVTEEIAKDLLIRNNLV